MPNIIIESDGTPAGTKVTIAGTEVQNIKSLYFDSYPSYGDNSGTVSFGYTVVEMTPDGVLREVTFRLPKDGEVVGERHMKKSEPKDKEKKSDKEKEPKEKFDPGKFKKSKSGLIEYFKKG